MISKLSMNQVLIEKLINILEVNLDKENFGVKELAKEAGLSRSKLHRKLKSIEGKSSSRFIREFRLQKAMVMLQNNVATASEVAYRVGFGSPTYFNTCFHNYYGYPPGEVKFRNIDGVNLNDDEHDIEDINSDQSISKKPSLKERFFAKKMVWINTFLILVLSIVSYNIYDAYKRHLSEDLVIKSDDDKSVAILPFKNLSDDVENQYFADGVSASIQNNLNKISDIRVIASSSMEKYRNSTLTAFDIAKEVNVVYLLEGSVQKHGDSIRVITNLVNARNDTQLQSFVFDWEYKYIFDIQNKIALEIAKQLDLSIAPEKLETIKDQPTENLEAYNLYLKGRFFWHRRTEEGLNKSIKYFNQALELDSTYALAYSGLADSYYILPFYKYVKDRDSVFNLSKAYAEKSLAIDKNNAEAHATLGGILCFKDLNWEESEKELKHAINLNPNYATAHQYYAELLNFLGKSKKVREQIDLALKLNPNSYIMNYLSALYYLNDGRFEEAIIAANKTIEIKKNSKSIYGIIADVYILQGKDDLAMEVLEENNYYSDQDLIENVRIAYNKSGMPGAYRYAIEYKIEKGFAHGAAYSMAVEYAYLNEIEKALDFLEIGYERNIQSIIYLKSDPFFKNLRSEPRFLAILDKLNLGGYE